MEKSKVLLLGSRGSLGEAIQKELSEYEILPFTRAELDISDFEKTRAIITEKKPDIIINCTAYNAVDACEESQEELEKANIINGYAVENLGKIAKELNIPLVHYSTDYVFDGSIQEGVTEDAARSPINNYGRSKALGEELLEKLDGPFYTLRVSWLFGKQGSGESTKKSFVDIVKWLAENKDELTLVGDESSSPTYIKDIAKETKYILDHKLPFGIYHVNNSGTASWYEYGLEILKNLGIEKKVTPVPSSSFPRPAKRPPFGKLINTKLPPIRPWQEALHEYLSTSS